MLLAAISSLRLLFNALRKLSFWKLSHVVVLGVLSTALETVGVQHLQHIVDAGFVVVQVSVKHGVIGGVFPMLLSWGSLS